MTLDNLTMVVRYNIKTDQFSVEGSLNKLGQYEVIENFLRSQMGAGKDESSPNHHEVYEIILTWHPEDDDILVSSNTGNKALRDGILLDLLGRLE